MMDTLQPPTDNLYKFVAIGGLVMMIAGLVLLFREQSRLREQFIDAQIDLRVGGYQEGTGEPTTADLRRPYFRREAAHAEMVELLSLAGGLLGRAISISFLVSLVGFWGWWRRVQRHDDEVLRLTAAQLRLEHQNAGGALKSAP